MNNTPQIEPEGLPEAVAAWLADVPAAVPYPELPAAPDDAATAAVLAAMADWPAEHAKMATHRADYAARFAAAAAATTAIEVGADDNNATSIGGVST